MPLPSKAHQDMSELNLQAYERSAPSQSPDRLPFELALLRHRPSGIGVRKQRRFEAQVVEQSLYPERLPRDARR